MKQTNKRQSSWRRHGAHAPTTATVVAEVR